MTGAVFVGLEKCGNAHVARKANQSQGDVGLPQVLHFLLRQERIASLDDFLAFYGGHSNHFVQIRLPENELHRSCIIGPREPADLPARETHKAVTAPDRMIEEGERMVLREGGEPERQLSEIHRHWISIHAVETFLGYDPLGEKHFVFVWRNWRRAIMMMPGNHEHLGKLPTGFYEERSGPHRNISNLER